MLSDLCHDFDTDTLSVSAFRTRAVTIDSVSSDIYDTGSVGSTSGHHRDASSVLDESRCTVSPALPQSAQTPNMEAGGTGCLVDLNTTDDADTGKWQPFSQGMSGLALFGDLQDVWYSSASVDWKPSSSVTSQPSDVTRDISESSVSKTVVQQQDSAFTDPAGILDTARSAAAVCRPSAGADDVTVSSLAVTDAETNHRSLVNVTSSSSPRSAAGVTDSTAHSALAASKPPAELSQVTSSTEHRDCLSDAAFGKFDECVTSSPAAGVSASDTTDVAVSNVQSTTSTVPSTDSSKQQNTITTDLLGSDVQVTSSVLAYS